MPNQAIKSDARTSRGLWQRYEQRMRYSLFFLLVLIPLYSLSGESNEPIPIKQYLDVTLNKVASHEYTYFTEQQKLNKNLEHFVNELNLSIDLSAEKNKGRIKYLQRVIETSVVELEVRDGYKLVTFVELKPIISGNKVTWTAKYSSNKKYKAILFFRYSNNENEYPFILSGVPLYDMDSWKN